MRPRRPLIRRPPGATTTRQHERRIRDIERAPVRVDVKFLKPEEEKRKRKRLRQLFNTGSHVDTGDLNDPEDPAPDPEALRTECEFTLIASGVSPADDKTNLTLEFTMPDYSEGSGAFAKLYLFVYSVALSTPTFESIEGSLDIATEMTETQEQQEDSIPIGYLIKATAEIETAGEEGQQLLISGGKTSERLIAALFSTSSILEEAVGANAGAAVEASIVSSFVTPPEAEVDGSILSVCAQQLDISSADRLWLSDGADNGGIRSSDGTALSWARWSTEHDPPDETLPTDIEWASPVGRTDKPLVWSVYTTCAPIDD